MRPFDDYHGGGYTMLPKLKGGNARRQYGHWLVERGQTSCAYCKMSLVDSYENWLLLTPNPPMRSGLGVGTRGEGRGTRGSALDSDKWGRWRPLVVVGGADGGPGQRRWGGVGGTACKGRQSRTGPVRLCGVVE